MVKREREEKSDEIHKILSLSSRTRALFSRRILSSFIHIFFCVVFFLPVLLRRRHQRWSSEGGKYDSDGARTKLTVKTMTLLELCRQTSKVQQKPAEKLEMGLRFGGDDTQTVGRIKSVKKNKRFVDKMERILLCFFCVLFFFPLLSPCRYSKESSLWPRKVFLLPNRVHTHIRSVFSRRPQMDE